MNAAGQTLLNGWAVEWRGIDGVTLWKNVTRKSNNHLSSSRVVAAGREVNKPTPYLSPREGLRN